MLTKDNAPPHDLVKAYMLVFGNEAGRVVLEDIETFCRVNMAARRDKQDRIDPYQVVAEGAAKRVLDRIQSMAAMNKNPQWQAIETGRQLAAAQSKESRS